MKKLLRMPAATSSKQLVLGLQIPSVRRWNIFLHDGSRMILAASVALLVSLAVGMPLLLLLLPFATAFYTVGVLRVARERRKATWLMAPSSPSSGRTLNVWRRPRLSKVSQKTLDL